MEEPYDLFNQKDLIQPVRHALVQSRPIHRAALFVVGQVVAKVPRFKTGARVPIWGEGDSGAQTWPTTKQIDFPRVLHAM